MTINVVEQSFTRLFTCLLEGETQFSTMWLQCTFVFSLLWGLSATIDGESTPIK